ncbi:hypothetical protein I4F81_007528 [Pyropia yezoensis]|uniref:Uncharacterized protein n=1 Tax=Pyropia yezoensis TaxID=2788 RepID=A0ACC3C4A4_PYRYE|nr:hypothetical protein I4F81_007528 [Neopyropia yezoensis]
MAASLPAHDASVDPFALVADDVEALSVALRSAVSVVQLPVLDAAAGHFFAAGGKRFRPAIVLLMSRAVAVGGAGAASPPAAAAAAAASAAASTATAAAADPASADALLLPSQRRLAEITEMIHTASLLHDDVIDASDTRRGVASVNAAYGNQVAVLAGDFLLARSSILLARLRNCDVVEELSTVIEHLTRELARLYAAEGVRVLGGVPPSVWRSALVNVAERVVTRSA